MPESVTDSAASTVGSTSTGSGTAPSTSSTSTGSTGAPTSTPAAPATALESVEAAAAKLESASSTGSTGTTAKPAGATTQPTGTGTEQPRTGVPPESRWPSILANARNEASTGLLREFGFQSKEELGQIVGMFRRLHENPRQFMQELAQELAEQEGDELEPLEFPEGELVAENGMRAYSTNSVQAIVQQAIERTKREIFGDPRLRGALQFVNDSQSQAEEHRVAEEGRAIAADIFSAASRLPHFNENKAEIAKVLASIDPNLRRRIGSGAALYMAYNKVLSEKVLPTIETSVEERVLKGLKRDANAGAGRVPNAGQGESKPVIRDGNVDDLAAHMARIASQG